MEQVLPFAYQSTEPMIAQAEWIRCLVVNPKCILEYLRRTKIDTNPLKMCCSCVSASCNWRLCGDGTRWKPKISHKMNRCLVARDRNNNEEWNWREKMSSRGFFPLTTNGEGKNSSNTNSDRTIVCWIATWSSENRSRMNLHQTLNHGVNMLPILKIE